MVVYPEPTRDRFPDLHARLDKLSERIEQNLTTQFPTTTQNEITKIDFSAATADDYLESMNADPEAMVPFFMKLTNITNRIFSRETGITGLSNLKNRKTDLQTSKQGPQFSESVSEVLGGELVLETALFSFRNAWQTDQRRHYRGKFENQVREELRDHNYDVYKGNKLTGEPDIVIDGQHGPEMTGEVRSMSVEDLYKRKKNFDSEAATAKTTFPTAHFVTVLELPMEALDENREDYRKDVESFGNDDIDAVFFHDEIDQFAKQLDAWGVTRQSTLPTEIDMDAPQNGIDDDQRSDSGYRQDSAGTRSSATQKALHDFTTQN